MSELILASESMSRRRLLSGAGLNFTAMPPACNEDELKSQLRAKSMEPEQMAAALARAKALSLSPVGSKNWVLGGDQTLEIDGVALDKPDSLDEARSQLSRLSAGAHILPTAAAIAQNGQVVWEHMSRPRVHFRNLSPEFIENYLAHMGEKALRSVGACEVEGLGAQLISRIDGDFFAVLGLPLLEVLEALRVFGVLPK